MQGIRSTMCASANDDLLGMIHVDTRLAIGVFTEKNLQILTVFANQAALRIANARYAKQAEDEAVVRNNLSRLLSPNLLMRSSRAPSPWTNAANLEKRRFSF